MKKEKKDLHFDTIRHEVQILMASEERGGVIHERDLQALYFGMPVTEEYRNDQREHFQRLGIRVAHASEGGSLFFPEVAELREAFREDEITQKYLQELEKKGLTHNLLPEQEEELAGRRGQDENAETLLVEGNLLRVISIARRYMGQGLTSPDLFCEGNQALVDAVRSWDPEKDCPITLYLIHHIRRGICAALAWPEKKEARDIMETLREQMAEAPDKDAIFRRQNSRLPVIGENPILSRLKLKVVKYPELVSPQELEVIRLRLGLTDGISHPVEEVAEHFGITTERAIQLENNFLRKYRRAKKEEWARIDSETGQ